MTPIALNRREREVLNAVAQAHGEFGRDAQFTASMLGYLVGPCAGSLASLTLDGLVTQRNDPDHDEGCVYQATDLGLAVASMAEKLSVTFGESV